jgi:hypothetical protein
MPDWDTDLSDALGCHHPGDRVDCEARMIDPRFEPALAIFAWWIIQAAEESLLAQTVSQSEAVMTTPPVSSFESQRVEVNNPLAEGVAA